MKLTTEMSVSSRGFRAKIRQLQELVQIIGKPNAKRIKRTFNVSANEWLEVLQTDQDRIKFELFSEKFDVLVWMIDGKIEYLRYVDYTPVDGTVIKHGDEAVDLVEPYIQQMAQLLQANTPKGLLIEDIKEVRDWLISESKGTSGRCTRLVKTDKYAFRLWSTPGGSLMISTHYGPRDLFVNYERGALSCSFTYPQNYCNKRTTSDDYNLELVAARKFIRKQFSQAFEGKCIRL